MITTDAHVGTVMPVVELTVTIAENLMGAPPGFVTTRR
jgi:hypothetical protein